MKNEVRDDPELRGGVRGRGGRGRSSAALRAGERGRRFIAERVEPYQREFGWHAVWSHEFIFPTVREQMEPVIELVRGYLVADYDFPSAIEAMRRRHRGRLARGPRRADRRGARGDARRERRQPADGAAHPGPPFLHRPGRQRPRPARAHRDRSEAGRGRPARPARRRDVPSLQRAAGAHRQRRRRSRPGRSSPRAGSSAEAAQRLHPRDWVGTVDAVPAGLPVSRQLGLPGPLPSDPVRRPARSSPGSGHRPGTIEGDRPRRAHDRRVRRGARRRHPRLPDDEPGVGGPVHQDRRARHGHGRDDVASGRARPRVRHPGRDRDVRGDPADRHR